MPALYVVSTCCGRWDQAPSRELPPQLRGAHARFNSRRQQLCLKKIYGLGTGARPGNKGARATNKPKPKRGAGRPQAYARQFTFGVHCRVWRVACVVALGVAYLVFRKVLLVKSVVDIYRQVRVASCV